MVSGENHCIGEPLTIDVQPDAEWGDSRHFDEKGPGPTTDLEPPPTTLWQYSQRLPSACPHEVSINRQSKTRFRRVQVTGVRMAKDVAFRPHGRDRLTRFHQASTLSPIDSWR